MLHKEPFGLVLKHCRQSPQLHVIQNNIGGVKGFVLDRAHPLKSLLSYDLGLFSLMKIRPKVFDMRFDAHCRLASRRPIYLGHLRVKVRDV